MLAVQIGMPAAIESREFHSTLEAMRRLGVEGLEINVTEPERTDPARLENTLKTHGLAMTAYATGADAKGHGLSLASADAKVRRQSVERCGRYLQFAAELRASIIIGYLKGRAQEASGSSAEYLRESMAEIGELARKWKTPVQLEATNRYESAAAYSLEETWNAIGRLDNPLLSILPDTFHMNIEETSILGSLARYAGKYGNVHLSDNNRFFPGLGRLDFKAILTFLHSTGYRGDYAIEGNTKHDLLRDLEISLSYLNAIDQTMLGKQRQARER